MRPRRSRSGTKCRRRSSSRASTATSAATARSPSASWRPPGRPTRTGRAAVWRAGRGRPRGGPGPVSAPATPGDCFWMALEASRIALKYMVPVIILSDGYLANGAEPWKIPALEELPEIPVKYRTEREGFMPYSRDPNTLARPWAVPGTPGLEHRIGGLEKQDVTGNVNYEPLNHERMVRLRAAKVAA